MTVGDRAVQVEHTKLVVKKRAKKDVSVGASLQLMQQVGRASCMSHLRFSSFSFFNSLFNPEVYLAGWETLSLPVVQEGDLGTDW
jgi:hypothetical protein